MSRLARFQVVGRFDGGGPKRVTVTIERAAGVFSVRPLHSRTQDTLPLSDVAVAVRWMVARAELRVRGRRDGGGGRSARGSRNARQPRAYRPRATGNGAG